MDSEKHSPDPLELSKEDLETLFEGAFNEQSQEHQNIGSKTPFLDPSLSAQFEPQNRGQNTPIQNTAKKSHDENLKTEASSGRSKSSLRMKYEAEVSAVKKSCGDLEVIRRKLGLSKRKMAQLLLVDPSAWTRWTAKDQQAPPHIYRALQWYLLLQEKHPQYKSSLWLNAVANPSLSQHEIESIKKTVLEEAWQQLDKKDRFKDEKDGEMASVKLQLLKSQSLGLNLQKKLQWLVLSQGLLLTILVAYILFF